MSRHKINVAHSARAAEYTDCISAGGGVKTSSTNLMDMTLKNLMVRPPVMHELWKMQSMPLLPSLPGPLEPGVVAPDRVLSMSQKEPYAKLNCLK